MREIHEGAKAGHYRNTLLQSEQLNGWRVQLSSVIKNSFLIRYADDRKKLERIAAKLWIYGATGDDQIGFLLVAERFPGTANSALELYQAGIRQERRREGHGRSLVRQFVGCGNPTASLYARCLKPSDAMVRLLIAENFGVIRTTKHGTRELERKSDLLVFSELR